MQPRLPTAALLVAALALAAPLAEAAAGGAADGGPGGGEPRAVLPVLPRFVDEAQEADVTTPCCTSAWAALNASDPDDTSFYDQAWARTRANGTTPANATVPSLGEHVARRVVWLPNGSWEIAANASAYDSYVSDSFDHLDADARVALRFRDSAVALDVALRCREATQLVPGPESCV